MTLIPKNDTARKVLDHLPSSRAALYEAALDNRAAAGFISKRDADSWLRQIEFDRNAVKTEAAEWGISCDDVKEISIRIFKKYKLIDS